MTPAAAAFRLVLRLDIDTDEASLAATLGAHRLTLVEHYRFDDGTVTASATRDGLAAEVSLCRQGFPGFVVASFTAPKPADRARLAFHVAAELPALPAALFLRMMRPSAAMPVGGWGKNSRLGALRLLARFVAAEQTLPYSHWNAAIAEVVREALLDPDHDIARAALGSAAWGTVRGCTAALEARLEREDDPELREELEGYLAQLVVAGRQEPWATLDSVAPSAFDVRPHFPVFGDAESTLAKLAGQASLERRVDVGATVGAWFRSHLFDATLRYVGFADGATPVGCLFLDGPQLDVAAFYLTDHLRYLPLELAELVAADASDSDAGTVALPALALARIAALPEP
jgi:hypothetical protein